MGDELKKPMWKASWSRTGIVLAWRSTEALRERGREKHHTTQVLANRIEGHYHHSSQTDRQSSSNTTNRCKEKSKFARAIAEQKNRRGYLEVQRIR